MISRNTLMNEEKLIEYSRLAKLDEADIAALKICREKIAADRELTALFEEYAGQLNSGSNSVPEKFREINRFDCAFRLLIALTMIPAVMDNYRRNNWPEQAMLEAMGDTGVWAAHCRKNFGITGLSKWEYLSWLRSHTSGRLIQLGRLQFNINSGSQHPAKFYRNKNSGELVALAPGGDIFNAAGFIVESHADGTWETDFEESADRVSGYPISPDGRGVNQRRTLDLNEWLPVLKQGDPVLNFHIPELGPLTVEKCADSFAQAAEFFAAHYPEYDWKAFHVETWFCDPQLAGFLSPDSNIIKFQSCGYLLPETTASDAVARVFPGREPEDRGSSLQKNIYRMLTQGITFHRGTLIIFKEDLPWRENCYRKCKQ